MLRETLDTGLFRSFEPHRIGFSHQTYSEFLAAQYLIDHDLGTGEILSLILSQDGSRKVVPQLRETAAWLAVMVPEVCKAILSTDPASILACDMIWSQTWIGACLSVRYCSYSIAGSFSTSSFWQGQEVSSKVHVPITTFRANVRVADHTDITPE